MVRCLLSVFLTFVGSAAFAQQGATRLQCVAKYYDYTTRDTTTLDIEGGYVEILKDTVRLQSFNWFGSFKGTTYQIEFQNVERVTFVNPSDALVGGSINRRSGAISLSAHSDETKKQLTHFLTGQCRPAKPLF